MFDDRAGVELLRDVMSRGADDLDAPSAGTAIRVATDEGGQERVMDVDYRHAEALEKSLRENLHVAGEHDEIHLAGEKFEHSRLCFRLAVWRHWDVVVRNAEP